VTYQLTNLTVVTGASSGIGAEIAGRLAARKARLLLTGRDAGGLRAVAGSLDPAAPAAELVTADLADPAGLDTLVAAIAGRPVDLLVNNAGVATYGSHADLDPRAEAGVIAVNCAALVALTRAVLPGMLQRRRGFVLNTASTIAFQPAPGQATYGASKAFVLSYSEALAEELRGTGVRVAAICPGATDTAFLGAMGRPEAATSTIYRRHGSAAHVADVADGMLDGHRVVKVVGLANAVMAQASRLAPRPVMRRLAARLLRPRPAAITALNEITVDAPAQAVWALLADPQRWPQWYAACRWVHSPAPGPLPAGATFDWKAHPVTLHSVVSQSVPGQVFRYTAASAGLHADHTFTLTTTPHGTRVLSKETQAGPLPAAGRAVLGPSLHRATQQWLENLAATASATLARPAQDPAPGSTS
jgi:short-subunit dehydrogenase/uncharacterized protein YndB with AHSA1/START domain